MQKKMMYVCKKIYLCIKYFLILFLILLIAGKLFGFTRMEIKPLSWKDLFSEDTMSFMIVISGTIAIAVVLFQIYDDVKDKINK